MVFVNGISGERPPGRSGTTTPLICSGISWLFANESIRSERISRFYRNRDRDNIFSRINPDPRLIAMGQVLPLIAILVIDIKGEGLQGDAYRVWIINREDNIKGQVGQGKGRKICPFHRHLRHQGRGTAAGDQQSGNYQNEEKNT